MNSIGLIVSIVQVSIVLVSIVLVSIVLASIVLVPIVLVFVVIDSLVSITELTIPFSPQVFPRMAFTHFTPS